MAGGVAQVVERGALSSSSSSEKKKKKKEDIFFQTWQYILAIPTLREGEAGGS
jgi:hypothetical protein